MTSPPPETGNRTSKTIAGTTDTNTIAANSNRLTQAQDVSGTANILHDAAGNIVNDSTFAYTTSDRGRLASVQTAGGTVSYLYNALNLRVYKSGPSAVVPTGAAYYLYDEAGQLLGEYDANGAPVYETLYLGMLPVGALKQTGSAATSDIAVSLYNVHADHIATPRVITRQDQTVVWRWDTAEAFGGSVPDQNPSGLGAFTYNQRFPGQVFDAETGLFQNWNREYNSRYGRYIESDPIGLRGGINTFAYVGGSPLRFADPLGLAKQIAAGYGGAFVVPGFGASSNAVVGMNFDWWDSSLYFQAQVNYGEGVGLFVGSGTIAGFGSSRSGPATGIEESYYSEVNVGQVSVSRSGKTCAMEDGISLTKGMFGDLLPGIPATGAGGFKGRQHSVTLASPTPRDVYNALLDSFVPMYRELIRAIGYSY